MDSLNACWSSKKDTEEKEENWVHLCCLLSEFGVVMIWNLNTVCRFYLFLLNRVIWTIGLRDAQYTNEMRVRISLWSVCPWLSFFFYLIYSSEQNDMDENEDDEDIRKVVYFAVIFSRFKVFCHAKKKRLWGRGPETNKKTANEPIDVWIPNDWRLQYYLTPTPAGSTPFNITQVYILNISQL